MATLQRLLTRTLESWYRAPARKPLFLYGAPKVGKTSLVEQFGAWRFPENLFRVDCGNEEQARVVFATHAKSFGGILGSPAASNNTKLSQ